MGQREKLVIKVLSGASDNKIMFDERCSLLKYFGFTLRIKGSHHIFYKTEIEKIMNLQPKNGKAKPYQVRQVRNIILKYKLGGEPDV